MRLWGFGRCSRMRSGRFASCRRVRRRWLSRWRWDCHDHRFARRVRRQAFSRFWPKLGQSVAVGDGMLAGSALGREQRLRQPARREKPRRPRARRLHARRGDCGRDAVRTGRPFAHELGPAHLPVLQATCQKWLRASPTGVVGMDGWKNKIIA